MPELPEVRTVAKVLRKNLLNQTITKVKIIYPKIVEKESLDFNLLVGKTLRDISTKGKFLIFKYDDLYLVSHLRMEGKYFIKRTVDELDKHEHIIFEFGDISLRYHDTRKFGRMILVKDLKDYVSLNKLGYEPFDKELTPELLKMKLNKKMPVKELLLDQSIMAGLGNIYVNEVLFASNISPLRNGEDISLNDAKNIINNSIKILNKAIKYGGTTIKSYTSSLGVEGAYQQFLQVHKRNGEKCFVCGTSILNIKVGGRSTYYCPNCQK
jgi:formamidopyrimidine-DNA glycosylase